MDSHELSALLYRNGVSTTGINSIRDNGITGEMFYDFCEEDIKDAFTVFKDRFIVRKLLRELRAPSTSQTNRPPDINRPADIFPVQNPPTSPPRSLKRSRSTTDDSTDRHDSQQSTTTGRIQSPTQFDHAEHLDTIRCYRNVSSAAGSKYRKSSTDLMHQAVSSSNEVLPAIKYARTNSDGSDCRRNRSLPLAIKTESNDLIDYANTSRQTDDFNDSQTREQFPETHDADRPLVISEIASEVADDEADMSSSASGSQSFEGETPNFRLDLVSSTICQFTPEELLGKKSVRGRPSEAQRLGTVLIRSAAQSARIWNSAPLLKDIPQAQKEIFMKHVLNSTPQLSNHTELVWARLREALQNRRKYLLDKQCGKRILKGRRLMRSPSDFELIDLTENYIVVSNIKREIE